MHCQGLQLLHAKLRVGPSMCVTRHNTGWILLDAVWGCRLCCSLSTKHGGSHHSSTKCLLPNTIYMSEQTDLGYPTRKNKPQGWRETVTQSTKVASSSQGPGELALLSGVVCKSCASVGWCGPEVRLIFKDFLKAPSWSADKLYKIWKSRQEGNRRRWTIWKVKIFHCWYTSWKRWSDTNRCKSSQV